MLHLICHGVLCTNKHETGQQDQELAEKLCCWIALGWNISGSTGTNAGM